MDRSWVHDNLPSASARELTMRAPLLAHQLTVPAAHGQQQYQYRFEKAYGVLGGGRNGQKRAASCPY